ncbi:MAG TPA: hypothetical protein ENN03_09165 [bacterium]|nr:hypothetical protein [bacterium]
MDQTFKNRIEKFKDRVRMMQDVEDTEKIKQTAEILQGMHFNPTLLFRTENFLFFTREDLLKEIDRAASLKTGDLRKRGIEAEDTETFKLNHISLLVYHYRLLLRLRKDEPEAWDEINELYEDD